MNLQKVVQDIRGRVVREAVQRATPTEADRALLPLTEEINHLRLCYEQLFALRNSVGRMPPSPNTFRARTGAILIRAVQRMLFWYTPQIQRFHEATATATENMCAAMEKQAAALHQLYFEVAALRSEMRVRSVQTASQDGPAGIPTGEETGFDHFLFALQNRMLGTEAKRGEELREYITTIDSLAPRVPDGPWLDLASGRGDWLKSASSAGRDARGLETNAAAYSHCVNLGLNVVAADPIAFLRNCSKSSFAVISAFHVVSRYPARQAFELIRGAVCALKPDGVLLLESANPASVVSGAHEVWFDPTHLRPLPAFTAEFLLEYFGMRVILQKTLHPVREEQRLPLAELDLVRQLNSLIYGPRTYALMARRSGGHAEANGQGKVA